MNLPPPVAPTPRKKNPVYRLADWFEKYPHYAAGFVAAVILVALFFMGALELFR